MHSIFIILLAGLNLSLNVNAEGPPKSAIVKCAVCRSLVTELHDHINSVDPRKKIDIGSFRVTADGDQKATLRNYAGSEIHMTELLESVCKDFKDYVQGRHKKTNKLEAIKIVINGAMNPRFGEYEMIQDPDLNKGLEYHCESIVEDFEDEIIAHFGKNSDMAMEDSKDKFCDTDTNICTKVKDEL